ncbi:MAG: C39 family peptidase [Planctomycetota bacterium]|nr:C39 family peptidase [Planctomycetota bacterium]
MKRVTLVVTAAAAAGAACALVVWAAPNARGNAQGKTPGTQPASAPASRPAYAAAMVKGVPHVKQEPDFCGEACVAMVLKKLGHDVAQEAVFDAAGVDPALGRGCYTKELERAMTALGFVAPGASGQIDPGRLEGEMDVQFAALHADLAGGVPSIVCTRYDEKPTAPEHFRLIVGYDPKADEVVYHDPALADGANKRMSRARLISLWPLKYTTSLWTVVRLRCQAGRIAAPAAGAAPDAAALAQHCRTLKGTIPKEGGFRMVVQRPFVVIGDETAADGRDAVAFRAKQTVQWASERLMRDYFPKCPDEIIDVWLFKDADSYTRHAKELFGETPSTPYGYFSSEHNALVMNIATGGGTLVHEMVHPFMAANFPACPSWFNEGLASLYEQCEDRDGHIAGRTNWRLAGLQKAIRAKSVPSFKALTATTTSEFYNKDRGTNYAQARYLCYYLQEQGKLREYYQAFRAAAAADPTGYATLQKTLGAADMDQFKKDWETWVLKLRFP